MTGKIEVAATIPAPDAEQTVVAPDAQATNEQPQEVEVAADVVETSASNVNDLPDWAQKMVSELRSENAKHRRKAKDATKAADKAAREAAEQQGKYKELYEAELTKRQTLEGDIESLRLNALRNRIGRETGLPEALVDRLAGDTEEAIREDAQKLLAALPAAPAGTDATKGVNSGKQPKSRFPDEATKIEFAARMGLNPDFLPD